MDELPAPAQIAALTTALQLALELQPEIRGLVAAGLLQRLEPQIAQLLHTHAPDDLLESVERAFHRLSEVVARGGHTSEL